jgi:TonB-linked SusC/RagA family outer membrane protein
MRKLSLMMLLLFASVQISLAQQLKITGKVTDASGNPVDGATVQVKGTKTNAISNSQGVFSIKANKGETLVIGNIGFANKEIIIKNDFVEVQLVQETSNLQDVVVVGYGTQKRGKISASIATVTGEQLIRRPLANVSMGLQGMAPGVTVRQGSGQPGADQGAINIRGIGSVSGSSAPLIIVDGVEFANMNDIDANVIENISVIKDASGAAVYGARGTNGVILITTKRGQKGKTSISFNSFVTAQRPTNMPTTLSPVDNMLLQNESRVATGSTILPFSQTQIDLYKTTAPNNFTVFNTDWQDLIFQNTGLMQNHNIIVSGGGEKSTFMASGTYLNQQGLLTNNKFTRYDLRINGDIEVTKRIKFSSNIFYTKSTNYVPSGASTTEIIQRAITMSRQWAGKFEDGKYGDAGQSNNVNPIGLAENSGVTKTETPTLSIRFALKVEPIKNLFLEVAYNNRASYTQSVRPGKTYSVFNPNPATSSLNYVGEFGVIDSALTYTNNRGNNNQYYASGDYSFKIAKVHNIKVQVGMQSFDNYSESVTATRFGLQYPDRPYFGFATSPTQPSVGGSATENALLGYFARVNYDLSNKYFVEFNARNDGSSKFGSKENKQRATFAGASAGWIFSREKFMAKIPAINFGKLRLSYGALGNEGTSGGNYPFVASVSNNIDYYFNNVISRGNALANIPNINLSWERSTQFDIGLDLSLLKNKLSVTFDYYEKKVTDMLISVPLPAYAGFAGSTSFVPANVGSMINKGWEFSATYKNKVGKLSYSITGNLSDVKNMVLNTNNQDIDGGNFQISRAGYPINSYRLYQTNGLYQVGENYNSPVNGTRFTGAGDIKYVDVNGSGVLNDTDRVIMGNNFPRYDYSTDITLNYGSFDLNVFIFGVAKRDNYISGLGVQPFAAPNWFASGLETALDRWTPNNPGAAYPRLYDGGNGNYIGSDFWLRNGAYLRVKHITLGYNLAKKWIDKMKIQQCRFYVSVVNPFTISNYEPGFDPEINNTNAAFYPIMRTTTIGFNVRF